MGSCEYVIFQDVQDELKAAPKIAYKPTLQMNLELDLSTVSLPEVFKLKGLRLSTLDEALAKGTDAYTVNVKELPQDTIEVISKALAAEFLRRNSK